MLLRRHVDDDSGRVCIVCKRRIGEVRVEGGFVCRYCVPVRSGFGNPTSEEIASGHIRDPEILERIDRFQETESFADLRFDDPDRLFFKGGWPNYHIPVASYSEISGYRIIINGEPIAFNSLDGKRAVFKACTDEFIHNTSKKIDSIVLEMDISRPNVKFAPYHIRDGFSGVCDSKDECLRLSVSVSRKLDSIIEENILHVAKS